MEEEKPIVQIILPSHANRQNTEELSRPPSAFPVEEAERLRAQESAGGDSNDEAIPLSDENPSRTSTPLPPQYDDAIPYHPKPSVDLPPYEAIPDTFTPRQERSTGKTKLSIPTDSSSEEKRRLDLEAVTSAIDRAYTAAPQFDDQRTEMRASGSRSAKPRSPIGQLEGGERRMSVQEEKELNHLFDQIERAHGHKLPDQSTEMDTDRAAERTTKKRQSFYQDLLTSSSAGRMHDQEYDLANASPRVSPLVKTFTQAGTNVGSGAEGGQQVEEGNRRSREVVDIHQAIRDGPGQI